jgi:hypothetical protein
MIRGMGNTIHYSILKGGTNSCSSCRIFFTESGLQSLCYDSDQMQVSEGPLMHQFCVYKTAADPKKVKSIQ